MKFWILLTLALPCWAADLTLAALSFNERDLRQTPCFRRRHIQPKCPLRFNLLPLAGMAYHFVYGGASGRPRPLPIAPLGLQV